MATRQNLIDTYNSNPTLQSKYTLPQYLALFDFSQTTTPTQTTTTTPTQTPATPGIPNIINQNLNQGGDGDNSPPGPTFNRNDLLGTSDYQGTGPGFFESIMGNNSLNKKQLTQELRSQEGYFGTNLTIVFSGTNKNENKAVQILQYQNQKMIINGVFGDNELHKRDQ